MQELSSLSADHHLGRIRMSGTYTVNLLVLRAEWHLGVSVFTGRVKNTAYANLQLCLGDCVARDEGGADLLRLPFIKLLGLASVLLVLLVFVFLRGASLTFSKYLPRFRKTCGWDIFLALILCDIQARRHLLNRFFWLVFVKKQMIGDSWVRTDHRWFNDNMHSRGFVFIRHHRLASLQLVELLASQHSSTQRHSWGLRHSDNLLDASLGSLQLL